MYTRFPEFLVDAQNIWFLSFLYLVHIERNTVLQHRTSWPWGITRASTVEPPPSNASLALPVFLLYFTYSHMAHAIVCSSLPKGLFGNHVLFMFVTSEYLAQNLPHKVNSKHIKLMTFMFTVLNVRIQGCM